MEGHHLRIRRKRLKLTQAQLGQALGLSQGEISKLERGKCRLTQQTINLFNYIEVSKNNMVPSEKPLDKIMSKAYIKE